MRFLEGSCNIFRDLNGFQGKTDLRSRVPYRLIYHLFLGDPERMSQINTVKRRSYSESDYKNVLKLREEGMNGRQISEKLGIPLSTAYYWYTGKQKPRKTFTKEENMKAYHRKHSSETIEKMRVSKIGSKNPMWKGDEATEETIRWRLKRDMPVPKGSDRHHIDGNGRNSDPNNIRVLTRRDHMIKDGRMEALIKRNKMRRGMKLKKDRRRR